MDQAGVLADPTQSGAGGKDPLLDRSGVHIGARSHGTFGARQERALERVEPVEQDVVIVLSSRVARDLGRARRRRGARTGIVDEPDRHDAAYPLEEASRVDALLEPPRDVPHLARVPPRHPRAQELGLARRLRSRHACQIEADGERQRLGAFAVEAPAWPFTTGFE